MIARPFFVVFDFFVVSIVLNVYNTYGDFLMKFNKKLLIPLIVAIFVLILAFSIFAQDNGTEMAYLEFKNRVLSGDVNIAILDDDYVRFSLNSASGEFYTLNPQNPSFK